MRPLDAVTGVVCLLALAAAMASQAVAGDPPSHVIENAHTRVSVLLPDAKTGLYRDVRFDWSGIVASVEAGGHLYFTEVKTADDGTQTSYLRAGTTDEFKVDLVLKEGDPADMKSVGEKIRIGVGILSSYWEDSAKEKKLKWRLTDPFPWTVETTETSVSFHQEIKRGPWGYVLDKTVALLPDESGFTIHREFRNTGERTIACDHYCHNWLKIDGQNNSGQYQLVFPFEPTPIDGWRVYDKTDLHKIDEEWQLSFGIRLWAALGPQKTVDDNRVTVINTTSGGTMTMTGDWVPSAFNLYAQPGEVCPEPFIAIDLKSSEVLSWTSTYRFSATLPADLPANQK